MIKNIILCADDYSQNTDICTGILNLLAKKRLTATSCLVNSPNWQTTSKNLNSFKNDIYIGLHLNLTFGTPLSSLWKKQYGDSFNGLTSLIKQCYTTGYQKKILTAEINAQVDAFTNALGKHPDFIDGHQHIQQLPGIRDVLIELHIQQKWTGFLRNTSNGIKDYCSLTGFPKRQLISCLGGNTFKKYLITKNIATNTSFAGIYNFKNACNYRNYFKQFLQLSQANGLIMCHPGMRSIDLTDPLYQSRYHEFSYLISDDFLQDLGTVETLLQTKYSLPIA